MPAVARIELQSPSTDLGPRLRVLCALPRAGSLGRVGAMVVRFGNEIADVILEQNPRTCRALLDGGGCDVAVVADDPLGQHILDDRGQGDVPIIVIARHPAHVAQRPAIRDDLLERGAFVCVFAVDASFAVLETAIEAARSFLARSRRSRRPTALQTPRAPLLKYLDRLLADPSSPQFSLLVAEIESFDLLNETLGRSAAAEVVQRVGNRLALGSHAPDVVAYLGGGRFGWLTEQGDVEQIETKLRQCAEAPIELEGRPQYLSMRIGVVVRGAHRYAVAEDVVRDGIIAARRSGQGQATTVFESGMRLQPVEDLRLELALRQAVAERAFRLEYQPIVELASGSLVGFEALVRWSTADGPVSPARFIPIAERTGLVTAIGRWVLGAAVRQLAEWNDEYELDGELMVSVNVSAKQLAPLLVDDLRRLLAETRLPPRMLKLEFTETAMADDPGAVRVLEACRELGVQVWVDDFGTGFSSLAYLQRFPINGLKLDKSFVDPLDGTPQSGSMARAILQIAHTIGVDTIAEGIENEAQREQLRSIGYRWGQGFLFSRPLRVGDAHRLLATRQEPESGP